MPLRHPATSPAGPVVGKRPTPRWTPSPLAKVRRTGSARPAPSGRALRQPFPRAPKLGRSDGRGPIRPDRRGAGPRAGTVILGQVPARRLDKFLAPFRAPCDGSNRSDALEAAQKHCSRHRDEVAASTACGCFYCQTTFQPSEIMDWIGNGQTALCPVCGTDSVIGDASGFPVSSNVMEEMNRRWFQTSRRIGQDRSSARGPLRPSGAPGALCPSRAFTGAGMAKFLPWISRTAFLSWHSFCRPMIVWHVNGARRLRCWERVLWAPPAKPPSPASRTTEADALPSGSRTLGGQTGRRPCHIPGC
jgi:hypothetical protein